MLSLIETMRNRVGTALLRRAVSTCSIWAQKYRTMTKPIPGPWTFKYHPWLREMHDSQAEMNIGQKAAQMGYTETMLNIVFFCIDVLREDCLYVLPNKTPDASDFSSARFDVALESSEHLKNLFSDVRNVGHKRAGTTNLYIRGSRGRSGLKSVPAPNLFFDERDEMDQEQVTLGLERASGQFNRRIWQISTPSILDSGINLEYKMTTQEHFMFKCPKCGRMTELVFPDCLVITADSVLDPKMHDSYIQCKECKNTLSHEAKFDWLKDGLWVPTGPKVYSRGFYINQLYSPTEAPWKIAKHCILADTNPSYEQELYNSKMGLPHAVKGAQVTDSEIDACIVDYQLTDNHDTRLLTTLGADIGNWIHVVIAQWRLPSILGQDLNTHATPRYILIDKFRNFDDLDRLMREYQINHAVVDMQPERRLAKTFADRFPGYVKLCTYARGMTGRSLVIPNDENDRIIDWRVNCDRTSWLDTCLGRFHTTRVQLPRDVPKEFRDNLKALVRKPGLDPNDNPIVTYVKTENAPDHFAHAATYAEIALPLAASAASGSDIKSFL